MRLFTRLDIEDDARLEKLYFEYRKAKAALTEYLHREDAELTIDAKETASGN